MSEIKTSVTVIVDRFEGGYVICVGDDKSVFTLRKEIIGFDVSEGDALDCVFALTVAPGGRYDINRDLILSIAKNTTETERRRTEITRLMTKLFKKKEK